MLKKTLLGLGVVVMMMLTFQPSASAQQYNCDALVVRTDGFFDASDPAVSSAASKLPAKVSISTIMTTSLQHEEDLLRELMGACPNLGRYPDLVDGRFIIILARSNTPGQSTLATFWDQRFDGRLSESRAQEIRDSVMIPYLREGNVAGAMTAGLEAFDDELNSSSSSSSGSSGSVDIPWGKILTITAIVLAVLALVIVLGVVLTRHRRKVAYRREAEKDLSEAAVNYYDAMSASLTLRQRVTLRVGQLEESEAADLQAKSDEFFKAVNSASARYLELEPMTSQRRDTDEWESFSEDVEAFRVQVAGLPEHAKQLDNELTELDRLDAALPGELTRLDEAHHSAEQAITEVQKLGFKPDQLKQALDGVQTQHELVKELTERKALRRATELAGETTGAYDTVRIHAVSLPERQRELIEAAERIEVQIEEALREAERASQVLEALKQEFNPDSFSEVMDNPSDAAGVLAVAREQVRLLRTRAGMEVQDFNGADVAQRFADENLTRSALLSMSVLATDRNIRDAKTRFPEEAARLARHIDEARDFCQTHSDEVPNDSLDSLRDCERSLGELEIEFDGPKPEYLRLRTQLNKLDSALQRVRSEAKAMRNQFILLREEISLAASSARSAINSAESQVDDPDAGSSSEDLLRDAKSEYSEAEQREATTLDELQEVLSLYKRARELAERAEQEAEDDISAAAAARRRRRNANNYRAGAVTGSSFGGGGFGSFGGGGSSFGGGGGGHSGGGSNF